MLEGGSVRVPQYISRPPMMLWFELDELMVAMLPIMFWMLLSFSFIVALILSGVTMSSYKKVKRAASRGFIFHIYYMLGGSWKGFNSVHHRRYRE